MSPRPTKTNTRVAALIPAYQAELTLEDVVRRTAQQVAHVFCRR